MGVANQQVHAVNTDRGHEDQADVAHQKTTVLDGVRHRQDSCPDVALGDEDGIESILSILVMLGMLLMVGSGDGGDNGGDNGDGDDGDIDCDGGGGDDDGNDGNDDDGGNGGNAGLPPRFLKLPISKNLLNY